MHRRKFLATAAAALALLLATPAVAQRAAEIPRIALVALNESTANMREGGNPRWAALLRELGRIGYVEGKTIIINRWSGEGRADDL